MVTKKKTAKKGGRRPGAGRKKVELSEGQWKALEAMCVLTDKKHRVARAIGHDEKTLSRIIKDKHGVDFSEFIHKRFEEGNFKLLSKQWDKAMEGNISMLIWLGKNRLGQRDMPELDDKAMQQVEDFVIQFIGDIDEE